MKVDKIAKYLRWFGCIDETGLDYELKCLGDGHSGAGWYVWCGEYPEDGAVWLGADSPEVREAIEVAKIIVRLEGEQLARAYGETRDLLLLVGLDLRFSTYASFSPEALAAVEKWAARTHLRASGNAVKVPPRPEVLRFTHEAPRG